MPEILVQERARFVAESRIELKVGLSEEAMNKLKRAQDLVSQKTRKPANLEKTIEDLVQFFLERQDPVEKAKRNLQSQNRRAVGSTDLLTHQLLSPRHVTFRQKLNTRYIYGILGNALLKINKAKDVKMGAGWISTIKSRFRGGSNEIDNLRTLCKAHHRQMHS